jgi:hypothetical protein
MQGSDLLSSLYSSLRSPKKPRRPYLRACASERWGTCTPHQTGNHGDTAHSIDRVFICDAKPTPTGCEAMRAAHHPPPECEAPKCLVLPCAAACAPCPPRASPALARRTDSTSPSGRVRAANPTDVAPARFIAEAVRGVYSPIGAITRVCVHSAPCPPKPIARRMAVCAARGSAQSGGCTRQAGVQWMPGCARCALVR